MDEKTYTIALAGNPNSGKTTLFNHITGTRQKVGNWPGVTVEKKEGSITKFGYDLKIIDLPGTYSLNASSPEEMIARDFLVGGEPDGAIVVVDAANLERNLYLAIQVIEIGVPTVLALNMSDVARSRGLEIDPGAPCVVKDPNHGIGKLLGQLRVAGDLLTVGIPNAVCLHRLSNLGDHKHEDLAHRAISLPPPMFQSGPVNLGLHLTNRHLTPPLQIPEATRRPGR